MITVVEVPRRRRCLSARVSEAASRLCCLRQFPCKPNTMSSFPNSRVRGASASPCTPTGTHIGAEYSLYLVIHLLVYVTLVIIAIIIADSTEAMEKVILFPMNFGMFDVLRTEIDSAVAGDKGTGITHSFHHDAITGLMALWTCHNDASTCSSVVFSACIFVKISSQMILFQRHPHTWLTAAT